MRRYLTKRQFRLGTRIVPAGDVVELTASAARYLLLRGWIEAVQPPAAQEPPPAAPNRRPRRRRS